MLRTLLTIAVATIALPALAQEKREMDAHVHGVTKAEIAVEHGVVSIDLHAPGIDIVGFEHAASTAADKDAVEAAIRQFLAPESIVTLPAAAGCRLTEVLAHLHSSEHDHEEEGGEHSKEGDHDHEAEGEHEEGEGHSEFHIRYQFACEDEDAVTGIGFPFFGLFANAEEIEAEYVTETGAGSAELTRDASQLTFE